MTFVCVCVSYSKNDVLLVFITALGSTTTTTLLLRGTAERRQKNQSHYALLFTFNEVDASYAHVDKR